LVVGTTVVGKCTDRFRLETGRPGSPRAIRHRFDWLVTGRIVPPDPAAWCTAPVATTSTRRGEPILAFDDGGARSIADAHDDPALAELLRTGAILQSIFAVAGMIDNNGWGYVTAVLERDQSLENISCSNV
jgi:hypothetical protein